MRLATTSLRAILFLIAFDAALLLSVPGVSGKDASKNPAAAHLKSIPEKSKGQFSSFCTKFNSACAKVCLQGKKGEQKIEVSCAKVEHTTSGLQFSCHCNGKEKTTDALKKLSGSAASTVTSSTTKKVTKGRTSTKKVTSTFQPDAASVTSTQSDISTSQLPDDATATILALTSDETTTASATETFVSSITETPLTTSFLTTTLTSLSTSISTSTSLSFFIPDHERVAAPILKVAAPKTSKTSVSNTKSKFCDAYSRSCVRECARVKSKVSKELCKKTKDTAQSDFYDLACVCANRKTESLHALNNIDASDAAVTRTATVLSTSTSYSYITSTRIKTASVVTNTVVSTISSTLTLPVTSTRTSTSLTTFSTTVSTATSTSTTSTTETETAPTSTLTSIGFSATVTSTVVIPTSTFVVLAPTGRLRFDTQASPPMKDGYLNRDEFSDLTVTGSSIQTLALMRPTDGTDAGNDVDPVYWLLDLETNTVIFGDYYATTDTLYDAYTHDGYCQYTILITTAVSTPAVSTDVALKQNHATQFVYLVRKGGEPRVNTFDESLGYELPLQSNVFLTSGASFSPPVTVFHSVDAARDADGDNFITFMGGIDSCRQVYHNYYNLVQVDMVFEFSLD